MNVIKFISLLKTKSIEASKRGFSMLELIIVLSIIAAIGVLLLPNMNLSFGSRLNHSTRLLVQFLKATYDETNRSYKVHRVVFDFKEQSYWTERLENEGPFRRFEMSSQESSLRDDQEKNMLKNLQEKRDNLLSEQSSSESSSTVTFDLTLSEEDVLSPDNWALVKTSNLGKRKLDRTLVFLKLKTQGMNEPISYTKDAPALKGYLYFFPQGFTSKAYIQLGLKPTEDKSQAVGATLFLSPFTGTTFVKRGFHETQD
jgi:prepilin-type N-terminal cleavage/methylation domain-containing protein